MEVRRLEYHLRSGEICYCVQMFVSVLIDIVYIKVAGFVLMLCVFMNYI